MKAPYLLDVPKTHPSKKDRLKAFKEKHGIETHCCHSSDPHWMPWTACWMTSARRFGYGVTEASDLFDCIAKVGRLLEEAEVLVEGKTEWIAVQKLCLANGIVFNP